MVVFNVQDFGAVADDGRDDSGAIQAAIDAAARHGPDARVLVADGTYLGGRQLILRDGTHLHLDEDAVLLKGYQSYASDAFIRTEPHRRGTDDPAEGVLNGLKHVDDVTITGGGTIRMASKALDGTGSYGPVILVAGERWTVEDITIDGFYATPRLTPDGRLRFLGEENRYDMNERDNAIAIQVVGNDHRLTDLTLLDGSHSYGSTGIRIFSGHDITIDRVHIESGDDMIAVAPAPAYTIEEDGRRVKNVSPLNQGDVTNVQISNVTGFSTTGRVFAAIDYHHASKEMWKHGAHGILLRNVDATSYLDNHGILVRSDIEGVVTDRYGRVVSTTNVSGVTLENVHLTMDTLPADLRHYVRTPEPYASKRGIVLHDTRDVTLSDVTFADGVEQTLHLSSSSNAGLFGGSRSISLLEFQDNLAGKPVTAFDGGLLRMIGTSRGDVLSGTEGADMVWGEGGDDHIQGGGGDDVARSGAGADVIHGGAGDDQLQGYTGDDRLIGGAGNDVLQGEHDDDVLIGGAGENALHGQLGDDALLGGNDAETLDGGDGDDLLRGRGGDDQLHGGSGADAMFGDDDADLLVGANGDDELHGGRGADRLEGGAGHDDLAGGEGQDEVRGGAGDDVLRGGGGRDRLSGEDGTDVLFGGAGRDELYGGAGDDVLHAAGGGGDWLEGSAGDDVFVISSGAGHVDLIRFAAGARSDDVLRLEGLGFTRKTDVMAAFEADGRDSLLFLEDGASSVRLLNLHLSRLHVDDFEVA